MEKGTCKVSTDTGITQQELQKLLQKLSMLVKVQQDTLNQLMSVHL